jgi:two-component system CheB/CheR fusion protein
MANSQSFRPATEPQTAEKGPNSDLFVASQELAPIGFTLLRAVRTADGSIVDFEWEYANPAALRALKASKESLLGQHLLKRLPGNSNHPDLFPRFVRTLETGEPSEVHLHSSHEGREEIFRNAVSRIGPDLIGVWLEDVTEAVRSEKLLRSRMAEIEALYQHAPVGLALFDSELRFLRINDTLAEINGLPADAHIGRSAWDIVPSLRDSAEPKLKDVLATGKTIEAEICGETSKSPGLQRWWHEKYYPLFNKDGAVNAVGAVVEEITERKAAENILKLSAMELRHRIKNLTSVVICLANQTFQGSDLAARRRDFEGRLRALDQANSLLGDEGAWWSSELDALIVKSFEGKIPSSRFTLEGPKLRLSPRISAALSMTLHELTTNAMKYGSLQTPEGRVELSWDFNQSDCTVEFKWHEVGGPACEAPASRGFGLRMIEQMIAAEGGSTKLEFSPEGLHCALRFSPGGSEGAL